MIKLAYVVPEVFTKYIEIALDIYSPGVMKFCPQTFENNLNKCYK